MPGDSRQDQTAAQTFNNKLFEILAKAAMKKDVLSKRCHL